MKCLQIVALSFGVCLNPKHLVLSELTESLPHLRATTETHKGSRLVQATNTSKCIAPGLEFDCSQDPTAECKVCCWYDPQNLNVYFDQAQVEQLSNSTFAAALRQGCRSKVGVNGTTTQCLCGPSLSSSNETATPSSVSNPSAAPSSSIPLSSPIIDRDSSCIPIGGEVDPNPEEVCNFRECCSKHCGCLSNAATIICRCSSQP